MKKFITYFFMSLGILTLVVAILWPTLYYTVPKVKGWTDNKFHISANKDVENEEDNNQSNNEDIGSNITNTSQTDNKLEIQTKTFTTAIEFLKFLFDEGKAKDVIDVRLTDTSYTGAPRYYEKAVQTATETTFETTVESYTVSKLNEYILTPARTTNNSIKFTVSTTATTLELYCQQSGNIQILVRDIKLYSDNITTISATFYNVQETLNQFTVRYFA